LEQRPDAGDDDPGPAGRGVVLEAPQHAEAPAHGLDAGADPLEGQRLPRREELDVLRRQELLEVVGQALRGGPGGNGDEQGRPPRDPSQPGEGERARGLGDGQDGGPAAEDGRQRRFVTKEGRERLETHRRAEHGT